MALVFSLCSVLVCVTLVGGVDRVVLLANENS